MGVDQIFISEYYELDRETARSWSEHGARIRRVSRQETIDVKGQQIKAIAPVKDMGSANENSLVLLTVFGGKRWLFTGDLGVDGEREIMAAGPRLSADILKVGHHGSNTSTNRDFVKQLQPQYALISAGKNNSYGHPAKDVLETLKSEGVHILRTDKHGAVQFHFKNEQGTFTTYLP
jgi:competence protein ComEC